MGIRDVVKAHDEMIKNYPERYKVECFMKHYVLDTKTNRQVGKSYDTYDQASEYASRLNRNYKLLKEAQNETV